MIGLKKILVATDFSDASGTALAYGRELARSFDAALTVLHVVADALPGSYGLEGGMMLNNPGTQQEIEAAAREQVDASIAPEDRVQLKANGTVLVSSAPAAAIVEYAREIGSNLIVMGTHGRGGIAHLLLGSVAEQVVRTAPCPVLTVRHPEHEFVTPDALVAVTKG